MATPHLNQSLLAGMSGMLAGFRFLVLFAAGHFLALGHVLAAATAFAVMLLPGLMLGVLCRLGGRLA